MTRRNKNRPSRKSCGKRRYRSSDEAITALHGIKNLHDAGAAKVSWRPTAHYHCPACKGWHLTTRSLGEPTEGAS